MRGIQAMLRRASASMIFHQVRITNTVLCFCLLLSSQFLAISLCAQTAAGTTPSKATITHTYSQLPLYFEKNTGQTEPEVKFLSRGAGYRLFLGRTETVLIAQARIGAPSDRKQHLQLLHRSKQEAQTTYRSSAIRMKFVGANSAAQIVGVDEQEGRANYFIGNDPKKWVAGVPTFAKVQYTDIYPGVDLVYYGNRGQLEYDLQLHPRANPNVIRINFEGASKLGITKSGDVLMQTEIGAIVLQKPAIYQWKGASRSQVDGRYVLRGAHELGIEVSRYDKNRALVIDPALIFSTYIGGTGDAENSGSAIDAQGNVYMLGTATETNFPAVTSTTMGTPTTDGSPVIVVTKVNASGTSVLYTTYLSGGNNANTYAGGVAVDSNSSVYVAGNTTSTSFPITSNAFQSTYTAGAIEMVFVSKLSPDGTSLMYSTYLGGANDQTANAVVVDANQVAYVGGNAVSGFPVTSTAFQSSNRSSNGNSFISKIDTRLSGTASLLYSTYLGGSTGNGSNGEYLSDLALDRSSRVYATGYTRCTDYPVTATAYQSSSKAQVNMTTGFFSELDTTLSGAAGLVYSSYLGGSAQSNSGEVGERGDGVVIDSAGRAYVVGITGSPDFPITVAAPPIANAYEGFLTKFDTTKAGVASLVYSRVVGSDASQVTDFTSVAVDSSGNAYAVGYTFDPYYPVTSDAVQSSLKSTGDGDAMLTIFSADASTILYSTFFGADSLPFTSTFTAAFGVVLDAENNIYVSGQAAGIELPTSEQVFQSTLTGVSDFFLAKFGGISTPTITGVSSSSGQPGVTITISGLNFGTSQGAVTFNGVASVATIWNPTSITVPIPVGAKSGNIVVTAGGLPSNGVPFTVLAGPIPIVLVQHEKKSAGTTTAAPLAFASNNSAGNWIGVCVRASGTNQSLSVSDSNGNLYRQALSVNESGGNTLAMFYAENIVAGPNIVTVSDPVASNLQVVILEYSGVVNYASLDTTVSAAGSGTSPNSGTATTTANGDLLLSTVITANAASFTAGTGYTEEDFVPNSPNTDLIAEDEVLSKAGSTSSSATLAASGTWAIGLAAFKQGGNNAGTVPTITSLSPPTGSNGTVVKINGYNFGAVQGTVTFNGTVASPTSWTDSAITVQDPAGATDGYVIVTVGGINSNGVWFAQPNITGTTPGSAAVGATITINGTHFGTTLGIVQFNGIVATATWGASSITATVPAGATTGPIVVTNSSGIASNAAGFTVTGTVPTVTSVTPTTGGVGTSVTIRGSGFGTSQGSNAVTFNGVPAGTAATWATGAIKINVPTGATTGNVVVTVGGQPDLQTNIFTVPGTPSVSGMSPVRGGVGAAITITGSNLGSSGTVKVNGVTAPVWSWNPTLIVVPAPSGATSGSVVVTAGGVQMSAGVFDVRSPIPSTATEFSYDAMGRVIQKTVCTPMNCGTGQAPSNFSVTYDLAGETTSISFNGPIISYTYDAAGRVTQVTSNLSDPQHPGTLATVDASNGYWPTGVLRKLTFANNLTEADVYNSRDQPCRINVNSSGTLLSNCSDALPTGNFQDLSDNFNAGTSDNGNVVGFKGTGKQNFNRTYVYDSLNRIQSMSAPGDQCSGLSWTIDPWGNRTGQNNQGGTCLSPSVSVDTNNRLAAYQYDASGDLTNDGMHTYTYDGEGRIAKVDGGSTAAYIYDAFGARVEKTASGSDLQYVYDQNGRMNTIFSNGASQRAFLYMGANPIAEYFENTTYFIHLDHLGSTRMLSKLDRTVRESDDYYPFGELIPSAPATGDINKFTGKERDTESGLDMFGARYYGSSLGRFMTPDWAAKPTAVPYAHYGNPQSLNLYSYVNNNPTTTADPDGHCPDENACSKVTVTVTKDSEPHMIYNQGLGPKGESGPYATGVGTTVTVKFSNDKGDMSKLSVKETPTTKDNLTGKDIPNKANPEPAVTTPAGTMPDVVMRGSVTPEKQTISEDDKADIQSQAASPYSRTTNQTLTFSTGGQTCQCTYSETLSNVDSKGNSQGANYNLTITKPEVKKKDPQ